MKYRLNKFPGYSLEDCQCIYCLHYAGRGKPCPLESCCCENEKQEAVEREKKKPDLPPMHYKVDPLQPIKAVCHDRPECEGCNIPGHGFVCGGTGACLLTMMAAMRRKVPCPV